MIVVELPETKYLIAATHLIPDGQEGLHEYFKCTCNPAYERGENHVKITHNTL